MPYYIQWKENGKLETVDEFDTREEARDMVHEYNMAFPSGFAYVSSRCCKAWKDERVAQMEAKRS